MHTQPLKTGSPFFVIAGVYVAGIVAAYCLELSYLSTLFLCILSIALILYANKRGVPWFFTVCIILGFFSLGTFRYARHNRILETDVTRIFSRDISVRTKIKGTVISEVREGGGGFGRKKLTVDVALCDVFQKRQWMEASGRVHVTLYRDALDQTRVRRGDKVAITCRIRTPSLPRNPGEFDYRNFLKIKRIRKICIAETKDFFSVVGVRKHTFLGRMMEGVRGILWARLRRAHLPYEHTALLGALLLGERDTLPEETEDIFKKTGTLHILAISGLHVGLIAFLVLGFLRAIYTAYRLRLFSTIVLLWGYAVLVGLTASVLRATIMITVHLFGRAIYRDAPLKNTLGFAGFLILLCDPNQLFALGFRLSFAAVFSILFLIRPVTDLLRQAGWKGEGWLSRYCRSLLAGSFACWFGLLPLIMNSFHCVSIVGLCANVLVIPLLSLILIAGFLLLFFQLLCPEVFLAHLLAAPADGLTGFFLSCLSFLSEMPFSYVYTKSAGTAFLFFYVGALCLLLCWRHLWRRAKRICLAALFLLFIFAWSLDSLKAGRRVEITALCSERTTGVFLDICHRHRVLIGRNSLFSYYNQRYLLRPFLASQGVNRVDELYLLDDAQSNSFLFDVWRDEWKAPDPTLLANEVRLRHGPGEVRYIAKGHKGAKAYLLKIIYGGGIVYLVSVHDNWLERTLLQELRKDGACPVAALPGTIFPKQLNRAPFAVTLVKDKKDRSKKSNEYCIKTYTARGEALILRMTPEDIIQQHVNISQDTGRR